MKKIITLALAAAMLASMAVTANANPSNSHSITAAYGTPVVDGQMDDIWNNAEMQTQDSFRSGTETDAKAQIRVMYDDNYLYVLEYVPDNTLWTSDLTLANYQYDTTEVCISLTNSEATSYDGVFDWWVGITPYGVRNTSSNCTPLIGGGTDVNDAEYLTVHTSLENDPENDTADGYWVEWAFNVKAIDEELVMDEGTTIGMEVSVNDNAEYNNRTMCMGWADTTDGASGNPSTFGNVVFGPKGGAAAEAPAASTTAAATAGEWVTEGLAALYDGANNANGSQDKETSTWKDSSGNGVDFEIDLDDTNYWTDNAFHANSAWCYFDDAIVDVVNGDKFTVEIVFGEFTGYGASFNTFLNSDNDNFAWFIRNDGDFLEFKNAGNDRPKVAGGMDFVNNSTLAITFDLDECEANMYVDGELIGQTFPVSNVGADTMFLAHADASRNWEADVHCIRFYNTALTAEQVAANAAADQAKYFTAAAPVEEVPAEETPVVEETPAEEVPAVEETPVEEVPAEEPAAEEAPVEEPAAEETVEAPAEEAVEEAPQTFDIGVIAAVAALFSLAGYTLTKKSR